MNIENQHTRDTPHAATAPWHHAVRAMYRHYGGQGAYHHVLLVENHAARVVDVAFDADEYGPIFVDTASYGCPTGRLLEPNHEGQVVRLSEADLDLVREAFAASNVP